MNILFVLENYHPHIGGVERVFKDLAEGLAAKGHKIVVVTHKLSGTVSGEEVNGVSIRRVLCFGSRYWFTFLSLPAVFKYARKADVIHTTTYNGAPPAWLAARLLRKPVIITVHEVLGERWKKFAGNRLSALLHCFFERMILKLRFDCYAAVSKSTARQLSFLHRKNINNKNGNNEGKDEKYEMEKNVAVVYNGLDYSFWNRKNSSNRDFKEFRKKIDFGNKFVGLFYGRAGITKGLEVLIGALPEIVRSIPNFILLIVLSKDKAYQKSVVGIKRLAQKLDLNENIIFLEQLEREKLPSLLAAVDCVIVPSLSEGFGFAVAEACAVGAIVAASKVDSIPEVVSGKWVLFEPGNAGELAKAVVNAYNGKYNRTPLRRFDINENIQNYLNIYGHLLNDEA